MMTRILIASAIAVSLVFATGARAHDDKKPVKKEERQADGHAAALGKPGDPGKVTRNIAVEMSDAMRFKPAGPWYTAYMLAMTASNTCAVQMLLVAFSRRMCCSRVCSARR